MASVERATVVVGETATPMTGRDERRQTPVRTPVALIAFNRPDKTARVLSEIVKAQPSKLFVIADGPRPNHPEDAAKCRAVRELIERVDWNCEVLKNYSDVNLGCGRRPASGISWVFEHVEEAIFLEDDTVPHPSFFPFCDELLEKYRHDERVMMIGGFKICDHPMPYSYHFSRVPPCLGGWATWRRAWQYWDGRMTLWPKLRDDTSWLSDVMEDPRAVEYWRTVFEKAYTDFRIADYWDYQWMFACWVQGGFAILPTTGHLISNIGFDEDATHTKSGADRRSSLPTTEMRFPLWHPPYVMRDKAVDRACLVRELPGQANFQTTIARFDQRYLGGNLRIFKKLLS